MRMRHPDLPTTLTRTTNPTPHTTPHTTKDGPVQTSYRSPAERLKERKAQANSSLLSNHLINHMVFLLDASGSMGGKERDMERICAQFVADLAKLSRGDAAKGITTQETRVSFYDFSDPQDVRCLAYDMDVERAPDLKGRLRVRGMTALIDATFVAIEELEQTAQLHGDHAYLLYVLTDGGENSSRAHTGTDLAERLRGLPDNWTVACMVPGPHEKMMAVNYGFPKDNIAVWDATSAKGREEAREVVTASMTTYMSQRSAGTRSTTKLFDLGTSVLNKTKIQQANLVPLDPAKYLLMTVPQDTVIRDWVVDQMGHTWRLGNGYYQLNKTETIQGHKLIMVLEKGTGKVYHGPEARSLVGLTDETVRVNPKGVNPDYTLLVQSTAPNRKLKAGQQFLYLKPEKN
jgi:hypothetical protein